MTTTESNSNEQEQQHEQQHEQEVVEEEIVVQAGNEENTNTNDRNVETPAVVVEVVREENDDDSDTKKEKQAADGEDPTDMEDVELGASPTGADEDDDEPPKPPQVRWPFPKVFYDPITNKIMVEPVVHPNGDSYEKNDALERDPDTQFYPNRALQAYMEQEVDRFEDSGSLSGTLQQWGESLRTGWQKLLEKSALPAGEYRTLPDAFYCPISFDLIHQPVIDPDGHTYEKLAIVHWIQANGDSPVTRKPLTVEQLYDNNAILNILQELTNGPPEAVQPSLRKWKEEHSERQLMSPIVPEVVDEETPAQNHLHQQQGNQQYPTSREELEELQRQRRQANATMLGFCLVFLIIIFFAPSYFMCFFLVFTIAWILHAPYRQRQNEIRRQHIRNQARQQALERQQQQQRASQAQQQANN